MQHLADLEYSLEQLIEQYRHLKANHHKLLDERACWQEERSYLLAEIDRILERLDDVPTGE